MQEMIHHNHRALQIEREIQGIDKREKELLRMGKLMHVLQEHRPLAEQASNKHFMKKRFEEQNAPALAAYRSARSDLEKAGIHSPQDLRALQEQFQCQGKARLDGLNRELGQIRAESTALAGELTGAGSGRRISSRSLAA